MQRCEREIVTSGEIRQAALHGRTGTAKTDCVRASGRRSGALTGGRSSRAGGVNQARGAGAPRRSPVFTGGLARTTGGSPRSQGGRSAGFRTHLTSCTIEPVFVDANVPVIDL